MQTIPVQTWIAVQELDRLSPGEQEALRLDRQQEARQFALKAPGLGDFREVQWEISEWHHDTIPLPVMNGCLAEWLFVTAIVK